jgi:hypothetical protein
MLVLLEDGLAAVPLDDCDSVALVAAGAAWFVGTNADI